MSITLLLNRKYFSYNFNSVFTTEMDVDNGSPHAKESITFSTKEEVIAHITEFCNQNPKYTFKVYETRGGIRVFCVSHPIDALSEEASFIHHSLKGDPLFWRNVISKEGYCARVSKKPMHGNRDYISKHITTIGTTEDSACSKVTNRYEWFVSIGRKLPVVNKQHLRKLASFLF